MRVGESRVELLAALGDDTPVGRFLAKRGPGMHHVAYEVDDVRAALEDLSEAGAELIDESRGAACSGSRSPSSIQNRFTAFSRRWCQVADERVRVEIGFEGGQVIGGFVERRGGPARARAARRGAGSRVVVLETEDGPYHVVVPRVAYFRRHRRAGRVGFASG